MSIQTATALWIAVWILTSALARTQAGARTCLVLVTLALPLPWLVHAPYQLRVVLSFALGFLFIAAVDFAADRKAPTVSGRLLSILALFALIDAMSAVAVRKRLDRRAAAHIAIAIICGLGARQLWITSTNMPAWLQTPVRIGAAAALIITVAEISSEIVRLISAGCGVQFTDVHDHPHLSRSVTEFWSRRWNLFGARWFRQHIYLRARRKSVALAVFALFAVSAFMHIYLIAAVVPWKWMLWCGAFFMAQPPLILAERALNIRRWHPLAARAWTIAVLSALLPLVLSPLLAALRLSL